MNLIKITRPTNKLCIYHINFWDKLTLLSYFKNFKIPQSDKDQLIFKMTCLRKSFF